MVFGLGGRRAAHLPRVEDIHLFGALESVFAAPSRWLAAETAAIEALQAWIALWDAVLWEAKRPPPQRDE